ncbi:MAG: S-methyl-5-thioribose-1-phosphate isomerase [Firmicutes bacterium]|nr:S-methyl-5-thioribose-1-phosphate isomerase [Bacillota bacterium]
MSALQWQNKELILLDQTKLPEEEVYLTCTDYRMVAEAIRRLAVRGAPAIGVAAAFGVVLGAYELLASKRDLVTDLEPVFRELAETRPTAVNLFWALARMKKVLAAGLGATPEQLAQALEKEAVRLYHEDIEANLKIGEQGAALLADGMTVLTICNTGALATVAHGTALAVIRTAVRQGKKIGVVACETRPLLQGARLTTWELMKEQIPVTLITDNMAGYLMQQGKIQAVLTGADRIAANGDVVNKIGTYTLAVLAREHGLPFYVAAPTSTIDYNIPCGAQIPIEERSGDEVTQIQGKQIAPAGVKVYNPAFDLTPTRLVTAVITERGLIRREEWEKTRA